MPFYNAEETLAKAVDSLMNQICTDFELILVDNNSTDLSPKIASKYQQIDSRIKVISEEQQGVMFAFNAGAKIASGKYLARMDADDIADKKRLELQLAYLNLNQVVDIVSSKVIYKAHRDDTEGFKRYVNWSNSILTSDEIYLNQFVEFPVVNPTLMWRKEVGDNYGLYRFGDFPEDYEMFLRWISSGVKYYKLSEELLIWHDSDDRLTRTDEIYSDESFFKIKTKYLASWLKENNSFYPKVYIWGASKISRKRAELLSEHGINIEAYIDVKETRQIDKTVIHYSNLPNADECFILVYLKELEARKKTKEYLLQKGYREGENFLMVS